MTSPQPEIPPPSPDDVLFEKREHYALITLNRPVVLNAINWSIQRRLMAALLRAEEDESVRVVVLTGAGRAFSAGGDIQSTPPPDNDPTPTAMDINMKIWRMPKPVIAAVHGFALGQGTELAGICDMTIADEEAVFGEVQIRHGFTPPLLITPFLTGMKQAKEVLMMGERLPAHEALRLGLVNRVVPVIELCATVEDVAKKLAALTQRAVVENKFLVYRAYEIAGFQDAINYREDPAIVPWTQRGGDLNPHLAVLRQQGWEAFRKSRDRLYGE
ncbi:MAG: enoyl-CoA hydratase/isomerase family protein [Hyphomicrobiales bacterium]